MRPDITIIEDEKWGEICKEHKMHPDDLRRNHREKYKELRKEYLDKEKEKTIKIIEVALPKDELIEEKCRDKYKKYKEIKKSLEKESRIQIIPVIIGTLGNVEECTIQALKNIGIENKEIKPFIKKCQEKIVKYSLEIYKTRWGSYTRRSENPRDETASTLQ